MKAKYGEANEPKFMYFTMSKVYIVNKVIKIIESKLVNCIIPDEVGN